jgi:hypothetical protein
VKEMTMKNIRNIKSILSKERFIVRIKLNNKTSHLNKLRMSNNPSQAQVQAAPKTDADTVPTQGIDFGVLSTRQLVTRILTI